MVEFVIKQNKQKLVLVCYTKRRLWVIQFGCSKSLPRTLVRSANLRKAWMRAVPEPPYLGEEPEGVWLDWFRGGRQVEIKTRNEQNGNVG